jgi:hypothetical protein
VIVGTLGAISWLVARSGFDARPNVWLFFIACCLIVRGVGDVLRNKPGAAAITPLQWQAGVVLACGAAMGLAAVALVTGLIGDQAEKDYVAALCGFAGAGVLAYKWRDFYALARGTADVSAMSRHRGWHPDPDDPEHSYRWWDGKRWTGHRAPRGPRAE